MDEKIQLPKFLENEPLPETYYSTPNPYVDTPSCHVDLPKLSRYAKEQGKQIAELAKEEVQQFAI